MIPFWIELRGLPKHYWQYEMLNSIGEELGKIMDVDISPSAAKLRVLINGLEPLTKDTVVEFQNGNEALVTLEYKNLKNHCHHCLRLSHETKNCPGVLASKGKPLFSPQAVSSTDSKGVSRNYYTSKDNFTAPRNVPLISASS